MSMTERKKYMTRILQWSTALLGHSWKSIYILVHTLRWSCAIGTWSMIHTRIAHMHTRLNGSATMWRWCACRIHIQLMSNVIVFTPLCLFTLCARLRQNMQTINCERRKVWWNLWLGSLFWARKYSRWHTTTTRHDTTANGTQHTVARYESKLTFNYGLTEITILPGILAITISFWLSSLSVCVRVLGDGNLTLCAQCLLSSFQPRKFALRAGDCFWANTKSSIKWIELARQPQ